MKDAAGILQRWEERVCSCGAAGSGEGHTDWCKAHRIDTLPDDMSAEDAVKRLRIGTKRESD